MWVCFLYSYIRQFGYVDRKVLLYGSFPFSYTDLQTPFPMVRLRVSSLSRWLPAYTRHSPHNILLCLLFLQAINIYFLIIWPGALFSCMLTGFRYPRIVPKRSNAGSSEEENRLRRRDILGQSDAPVSIRIWCPIYRISLYPSNENVLEARAPSDCLFYPS